MKWSFVVEGQPVSWNASYGVGVRKRTGGRNGQYHTIIKKDDAVAYTNLVMLRAREARPSGWRPEGLVVVEIEYFLGRNIDCDNVMKLVNDGLARAIEVDDKWFLPRAMSKEIGLRPPERRLVVSVSSVSP